MAGLEGGIPPCPPEAPAPTPSFGGGKPLGGAHTVIPASAPTINRISTALKNLALVVSNDTTVLQQLTAANLFLIALVTLLMTANMKLADALARNKGVVTPAAAPTTGGGGVGQTSLSWETIAGPMVIRSAKTTRVQPVGTRP